MTRYPTIVVGTLAILLLAPSCSPAPARATSWELKCVLEDGEKSPPLRIRITEDNRIFVASGKTGDYIEQKVSEAAPSVPHFRTDGPLDGSDPFAYELQRNSSLWSLVLGNWLAYRDYTDEEMNKLTAEAAGPKQKYAGTAVYTCDEK